MKIIIDITSTQDQFASRGIGRFTKEVVSQMISQSAESDRDDIFYLLTFNSPTTLEDTISAHPEIVRTVNIGKLRLSDKFNTIWWRTQYLPRVKKLIQEEDPDLYFCPYFWRHAPYKKIPTFTFIHDLTLPVLGKYSTAPKYLDWIRKFQYHRALNKVAKAAGVITNSHNTKKDLLKYVDMKPGKVHSVYLGVSDAIHEVQPDKDVLTKYLPLSVVQRGYILYYAGVEPNKNVKQLVLSYKEFKKMWERRDLDPQKRPYLVLAGGDFTKLDMSNPVLAEVRYTIDEEQLVDDVYFTGFFDDSDANDLLSKAAIFTHLSLYEGFGLSPLEAMKTGTPVVASDCSCYPEVLGEGAILVDPDKTEKVAQAFFDIVTDDQKAQELGQKGKKHASKYTWDTTAKRMYRIFEKFLEKKKKAEAEDAVQKAITKKTSKNKS
jgi:glycosyltransferase involved in cell wall biosynthesis